MNPSSVADASALTWNQRASLDPAYPAFQAQAIRDSGLHPNLIGMQPVTYRMVLPDGRVRFDLHATDPAPQGGSVAALIQSFMRVDTVEWIARIFLAPDFASLKHVLKEQRCIVRYERRVSGDISGHIIPSECSLLAIDALAMGVVLLDNGELVQDTITRMLGLRMKIRSLLSHSARQPDSLQDTTVYRSPPR